MGAKRQVAVLSRISQALRLKKATHVAVGLAGDHIEIAPILEAEFDFSSFAPSIVLPQEMHPSAPSHLDNYNGARRAPTPTTPWPPPPRGGELVIWLPSLARRGQGVAAVKN